MREGVRRLKQALLVPASLRCAKQIAIQIVITRFQIQSLADQFKSLCDHVGIFGGAAREFVNLVHMVHLPAVMKHENNDALPYAIRVKPKYALCPHSVHPCCACNA